MNATLFRGLVATAIALPIAGGFVDIAFPQLISGALAEAVEAEPVAGIFEKPLGLGLLCAWAIGSIAGVVGMFFFKAWARSLTFWLTAIGFAIYPALGSTASSWLSSALTDAGAIAWGAMLAFAYCEPVSSQFAAPSA